MGEEFCSEEVCRSSYCLSSSASTNSSNTCSRTPFENSKTLLHTSSLQNSSPIPFNGHLLEVINAPANKWSLRAPWAPKLYHCEIEREVVFETRSRSKSWYTNSYSIGRWKSYSITRSKSYSIKRDRSRNRSRIRLKVTEVVIEVVFDYEIEVVFD